MAIIRCDKGLHYYNNSEYASCPYCSGDNSIGQTIPLDANAGAAPVAAPVGAVQTDPQFADTEILNDNPTVAPDFDSNFPATTPVQDVNKTIALDDKKNSEVSPVRGWLVVIEGEKMGMDFRICTARNSIGRSSSNKIAIDFDKAISKENACNIVYDDRNNVFYIIGGDSQNNIYVNNEILLEKQKLVDNDIIEIGQTKLVFRSLCNETFNY
ncbi:MAG: FHA domain-containing protein [Ruminococcaceae bacterium]|nr:FHA domain-containing protein [Oscillospiraceae bacterium]